MTTLNKIQAFGLRLTVLPMGTACTGYVIETMCSLIFIQKLQLPEYFGMALAKSLCALQKKSGSAFTPVKSKFYSMDTTFEIYNLSDDGTIPNSKYPVIVYRHAFTMEGKPAADFLETRFAENDWTNAFRWKVYDFHHYHTNTHEILGVYAGNALLQLGGPEGVKLHVRPGDVIILPAGTGHIGLSHSDDFGVVAAYPGGVEPDLIELDDQRPEGVREKVDSIAVPGLDPFFGNAPQGVIKSWRARRDRSGADQPS